METSYFNLFIDVKTLEQIKGTATVVIDTNVLLLGYQSKNITFESVLKVLKPLSKNGRLKIPSHVIKEFSQQRPNKIEELSREIHNVKSNLGSKVSNKTSLGEVIPALSILEKEHSEIITLEDKYNKCIEELNKLRGLYVDGLTQLQQILGQYIDHDVILNHYQDIIKESYFEPEGLLAGDELEKEWNRRIQNKIPPGYKDSSKKVNQFGDLIIWDHISKIQNDVIFVTNDVNKGDWVYKVNDEVLGARRELVEEFYTREGLSGFTLKVVTPRQFITLFSNEEVEQAIKDDLDRGIKSEKLIKSWSLQLGFKEMRDQIRELRNTQHLKESYLDRGFDEIERLLSNFLLDTQNHEDFIELSKVYKDILEKFVEDPSSEFIRSIDVNNLIDIIKKQKEKIKLESVN
ncbi:hypothetical protein COE65_02675 [Bacillus sp. AFS051223]|uniref:PIN-like domain-containing protein n=1 Tax=Bacillus sp. AFS051223 TaxID=2034280 RepID=UPI000BECE994|nr:PIN-like domain-containing protein [Bacillus sp. AFS051223]PEF69761.1 hypothetical protein CON33_02955 [Bacillus anthracis]PFP41653.1 hypothetical protein COJ93_01910 [Bacillus anthracis]PHA16029.1 hypothetical protein COE65_02675 [Bacillus sp. AFS051223]